MGVLFGPDERPAVLSGQVSLIHRRCRAPLVYAGRMYRTNVGRIVIDDVTEFGASDITDADAVRAGKADADDMRTQLRGQRQWPVFRIAFHLAQDVDPRAELAAQSNLTADVGKLNSLGLTYSLEVGYRLAPRGVAYLGWLP